MSPEPTDATTASRMELARRERTELAGFLAELSDEQWQTPSLCEGWRVRDVVAHVISYDELSRWATARRLLRAGFSLKRGNTIGLAHYESHTPRQLLDALNAHLTPRGLTTAFGGMVALVDGTIHHQDIRRPLGMPRRIPPERLAVVLRLALGAPPIKARQRAKGLRLVATDCDFVSGTGPEVRGPGEALLMTLAGRPGVASELSGDGQPILAGRVAERTAPDPT